MCDKSFGDPKLLGELLLCFLCDLANEFGLHIALYLTQKSHLLGLPLVLHPIKARLVLALLKYPLYPLFILDNGMNLL